MASSSSDGTLRLWDVTNVKANSDIHAFATLQAIPCIALTDCDFSGAKFATPKLRQIIKMNGGIVEE